VGVSKWFIWMESMILRLGAPFGLEVWARGITKKKIPIPWKKLKNQ